MSRPSARKLCRLACFALFVLLLAPELDAQRRGGRRGGGRGGGRQAQAAGPRNRPSGAGQRRTRVGKPGVERAGGRRRALTGTRIVADPPLQDPGDPDHVHPRALVSARAGSWLDPQGGRLDHELLGAERLNATEGLVWWRDERDGAPGVYCARLDAGGTQIGDPWELEDPWTVPPVAELAVATNRAGRVVFAWRHEGDREGFWMRYLEAPAGWSGPAVRVELPPEEGETPDRLAPISLRVGVRADGSGLVCWNRRGRLVGRAFEWDSDEPASSWHLNDPEVPATGRVLLETSGAGELACAWASGRGTVIAGLDREGRTWDVRMRGVLDLEPDRVQGGWWVLRDVGPRLVLRRLHGDGRWAKSESAVYDGFWEGFDLRAIGREIALFVTLPAKATPESQGDDSEAVLGGRLIWVKPDGLPRAQGASARWTRDELLSGTGRLSASAERGALVWPIVRDGRREILTRELTRGRESEVNEPLSRDEHVNRREQTAAAAGGETGWFAWTEYGDDDFAVQIARIAAGGPEAPLALPVGGARLGPSSHAALAAQRDGSCLAAWIEQVGRQWFVFAQFLPAVDLADAPAGAVPPAWPVDIDQPVAPVHPPAVAALPSGRGFLLSWVRMGEADGFNQRELCGQFIGNDGVPLGTVQSLARGTMVRNPAVCALDDGGFALAWDEVDGEDRRAVRLQLFDRGLVPATRNPTSIQGALQRDWRPRLAPAKGGVLVVWNADDDRQSDAYARYFDSRGEPASRLMALSPALGRQLDPVAARVDLTGHVVLWVDLQRGLPEVHARGLADLGARVPGELVRLGPASLEPTVPPQREPAVAPSARGALVLWSEAARARGWDLAWGRLEPGFDAVEGRSPPSGGR